MTLNYPLELGYIPAMAIGEKIRRIRRQKDLSQEYVADKIGVTTAYISKIENDKSDPDSELIRKFAAVLDVSPGDLFDDPAQKISEPTTLKYSMPGNISERQRDRINLAVKMLEDDYLFKLCEKIMQLPEDDRKMIGDIIEVRLKRK